MSSKVLEANAKIHSLAMAVAVSRVLRSSPATTIFHEMNVMTDGFGFFWLACSQLGVIR